MTALAHKIAIEAVTKLESGEILVKSHSPGRLSEVKDGIHQFRFYAQHLSYTYRPDGTYSHPGYIFFDVEEKLYLTSNHCTKISFFVPEAWRENEEEAAAINNERRKNTKKKILAFIEKIMAEANIKPVPRFSLTKYARNKV